MHKSAKIPSQDCTGCICIIFAIRAMTQRWQKRNRFYCFPASKLASAVSQSASQGNSFARMRFFVYEFSIYRMCIHRSVRISVPGILQEFPKRTRRICWGIDVYDVFMLRRERFYYCAPKKEVFNSILYVSKKYVFSHANRIV